jgi:hypothetical protein
MAFDGNTKSQSDSLHQKCETMAIAFTRCQLSPEDAIQGYRSIFLPRARYGMSATNIPTKHIHKAQQLITIIILSKMGYNRHMPTPVVCAPIDFGGIGLANMIYEQGIAHTHFVTKHIRHNTDTANTIIILLETYMLVTGTTNNPLENLSDYQYIHSPWIQTLRNFLAQSNTTIKIPHLKGPTLLRTNDQTIMNAAKHKQFSTRQL